jgi:phosphatidylglycerol:prolipoprotein diacylglycerol transferase
MYPELFRLPVVGLPINSYGFMIMVGFLLAAYIAVRRGRALGIDSDLILDVGIIGLIAGMLGAKINHMIQFPEDYRKGLEIFNISDGGLHWLGGLILGPIPFLFWWWRAGKVRKVDLWSWQNGVLLFFTLFFALLGTRALHLYLARAQYDWSFITRFQTGFVLYGGLIAGVLAAILYVKMRGERVSRIADLGAPAMMVGIGFGRVGCFLNGCCWGRETSSFLGVRFPHGGSSPDVPVLPTQLFETAAALLMFVVLTKFTPKKRNDGEVAFLAGILYSAWRFIVEFLRNDPRGDKILGLTYSQVVSILVFAACAVGFFLLRRRAPPLAGTPGDKLAPEPSP